MPELPLRGRGAEMRTLHAFARTLRRGRGGALVVEGPAGIGKSRLLRELTEVAASNGTVVAAGRADEIGTIAPLAPLLAALSGGGRPVLRRDELLALERPGDQRFWLLEELAELLELRSRDAPILIVLDDMQWAEPVTAGAVRSLSQRLSTSAVGWAVALRPDATQPAVVGLVRRLREDGATFVSLPALAPRDIDAIAADVLGGEPDEPLRDFLLGVAGNPFLGVDLARALDADGCVAVRSGVASLTERRVPDEFRAGVRGRLSALPPGARHFLQAGSVFGRTFRLADVAAMLATLPSTLVPVVGECVRTNLLAEHDDRVEFCHDLIREAINDDMTEATRTALHRGAAAAVLVRGGTASDAASHLLASAQTGDADAAAVLQEAAREIAGQAPRTAAELALRAIEIMSPGQPGWTDALVGTVGLAAWGSRFNDAIALARRALAQGLDAADDAVVRLGLADALMLGGRRRDVVRHCRDALANPDLPPPLACRFRHNLGFALAMDGELDQATTAYTDAIEGAGDDRAVVLACRIGLAFVRGSRGDLTRSLALGEDCMRAAEFGGAEERQRFPHAWYATALCATDRFDAADAVFAAYRRETEEFGAAWAMEFCQRNMCLARMEAGRLDDAAAEAEANLALIDELDMWHDSDVPFGVLALVALHHNDVEGARTHLARAREYRAVYGRSLPPVLNLATAMLRDVDGDHRGAVAAFDEVFELPDLRTQNLALEPALAPVLVRLARRAGDVTRAERIRATIEDLARGNPTVVSVVAAAAHARALCTGAVDDLVDAAHLFETSPRLLARASACEDAGRALVDASRPAEALALLQQARGLYRETGAVRDEARVQQRLRAAGIRPRPQSQTRPVRATRGWDSLTSAELRVVRLVAEGLTNRQVAERLFLSVYTVGTHLKHAFEKLSVSSRVELARVAMERTATV